MAKNTNSVENTGFSNNAAAEGSRLANKDGSYNIRKVGLPFLQHYSVMHTLIRMKNSHFFLLVFAFYFSVNLCFALVYYFFGIQDLQGVVTGNGAMHDFLQAFFFSAQTITTVGYGHIHPTSILTNVLAAIESFLGILTFAVITGLLYARFSQPRAYLKFSENLLLAPFREGKALMFRVAAFKNNNLINVSAQVFITLHEKEDGKVITKFYNLDLQINQVNSLATSWTIVHPITEKSPIANKSLADLIEARTEVLVQIQGMDDQLYHTVQQKTSYLATEIVDNAKFNPILSRSSDGLFSLVDISQLNDHTVLD